VSSEADTCTYAPLMVSATRDFGWLTARSGYVPGADARGIQAARAEEVVGMVVFDAFTETIALVHVALASPRAAAALFRPAMEYAFLQAGRIALVTMLDSRNTRAVRLAVGLGFRETHRVVDGVSAGADLIHLEMRRHECRALKGVH
jgi:RimJ/RimL family protein N-acetyltransferase